MQNVLYLASVWVKRYLQIYLHEICTELGTEAWGIKASIPSQRNATSAYIFLLGTFLENIIKLIQVQFTITLFMLVAWCFIQNV